MMLNGLKRFLLVVGLLSVGCLHANEQNSPMPATYAKELQNRFRIDHMVDNMTLYIQRDFGSAPVVIVLPDGSKWYSSRHPDTVKWVDGLTADMIYIDNPQPGPWQLLGQIVKGSTIHRFSDLQIEVDPLPQPLFRGERLNITSRLLGDGMLMRMPGLSYMVEWTARFISQNDTSDENYARGSILVGHYTDNGQGLDQRPDDGQFTSDINLDQPTGDYRLSVIARNNIFERQFTMPFTLSEQPIITTVMPVNDTQSGEWKIEIAVNDLLVLAQTHVHFELVGPAGLKMPITLLDISQNTTYLQLPKAEEYGSYRIQGIAVSTTVAGREIYLTLPEMFFNYLEPPAPPPTAEELAAIAAEKAAIEEAEAKQQAIFWIITVNLILLVVGIIGFIVWRKKQSLAKALAAAEQRLAEEENKSKQSTGFTDDIDLTMPDD
ncbi:TIGR03503 family protein [Shewanella maritima]|uniref:TIGR03503 family protein n=1 Tax=Shewanella maritima TaxID=2520507 RepID=UPI0037367871